MNCPATSWSEVIWRCCLLEAGSWENLEKNEERTDWDVCLLIWCNNFSACSVLPGTGSSWTQIAAFGSVPDDAQDPADFVQAARIQSMSCAYIFSVLLGEPFTCAGGRRTKDTGHFEEIHGIGVNEHWILFAFCSAIMTFGRSHERKAGLHVSSHPMYLPSCWCVLSWSASP